MQTSLYLEDFIVVTKCDSEIKDNYFNKNEENIKVIKEIDNILETENTNKYTNLEKEHTKLLQEHNKIKDDLSKEKEAHYCLKKRHTDLLKMMSELLKIKQAINEDDNLEEIRTKITQVIYNEVRRHSIFPFTSIMSTLRVHSRAEADKKKSLLNLTL
jgi:hypothetical protein